MAKKQEMDWDMDAPTQEEANIDLAEMNRLVESYAELRAKKEALAAETKEVNGELDELEAKMLEHLENANLPSFRGEKGLVSVREHFSVKVPKTLEDKRELFNYLKKKGVLMEMASINSSTLNGFYKEEMAAAQARGEVDFKIPGVGEPTASKDIAWKKATK